MNPVTMSCRRQADTILALSLAAGTLALATLYLYPPASAVGFYPQCPVHRYTGLLCPGCGATRALAALTHGRLAEAMHDNGLFVLLLPVIVFYLWGTYLRARRGAALPQIPRLPAVLLACAAAAFTLIRNLP